MALGSRTIRSEYFNFSDGIIGQISDRLRRPTWAKYANNVLFRPIGGLTSRLGSRSVTSWGGPGAAYRCNTLAKWYDAAGGPSKLFGYYTDGTNKKMYEIQSAAGVLQTLPATFTPDIDIFSHANINGLLVMAQHAGSEKPIMFDGTTWNSLVLPSPTAAPTVGAAAAGGLVDVGNHYYRVRWVHKNGSSIAGPVTAAVGPAVLGTQTMPLSALHPATPRTDYLGARIERTKLGAPSNGRWYWVADVPAATATYNDIAADAALNAETDEGLHTPPAHFDGVVAHRNRLIGWDSRALYVSQLVGDAEATGLCNFDGDLIYPAFTDDGDAIQCCVKAQDRVIVFKTRSILALEGDNPNNFQLRPIVDGIGAIGPRAAAAIGGVVYFQSRRGWERLIGNRLDEDFSFTRMGHYFETINVGQASRAVVRVVENEYVLFAYPSGASNVNSDIAVFDLRRKNWTHWTEMAGRDYLVQKDGAFSSATLLFADEGSSSVWIGLDGVLDKRAYDNSGGSAIPFYLETPPLDEKSPDFDKDIARLEIQYRTGSGSVSAQILCDSGARTASLNFSISRNNSRWGPATPASKTLRWGPLSPASIAAGYASRWGSSGWSALASGLPENTIGRDYVVRIDARLVTQAEFRGFVTDFYLRPNRGLS